MSRIPESEWRWRGMPGHLIVSTSCCFHMVTDIGEHRISTIGCYHKAGDPKDYHHRTPIGAGKDSLYETYVFKIGAGGEIVPSEIDAERYAEEADAEAGHMAMCRKWADPALFEPVLEGAA